MGFKEFEIALAKKIDQVELAIRERGMASLQAEEYSLWLKDEFETIYPVSANEEQQAKAADLMNQVLGAIGAMPDIEDQEALAALQEIRTQLNV